MYLLKNKTKEELINIIRKMKKKELIEFIEKKKGGLYVAPIHDPSKKSVQIYKKNIQYNSKKDEKYNTRNLSKIMMNNIIYNDVE